MTRATIRRIAGAATLGAVLVASAGCGDLARTGRSSGFLIIDRLDATSGSTEDRSDTLNSDVETFKEIGGTRQPVVFSDLGHASLRLGLKNPGAVGTPTSPSPLAEVTVTRYRVAFVRSDGRNTPGVDVPFGFDGAVTATVSASNPPTVTFPLVTHAMKREPPLRQLAGGGGQQFIHTLAEVTFYGRDQAGNEVSVSGMISVNFGDFADPD